MRRYMLILLTITLLTPCTYAGESRQSLADDPHNYVDDLLGCAVKYDDQGSFKSIKCPGEAEMDFADAKGIRIAKQKAVLRAKAALAKFMKERIHSQEVMEDMTKTLSERTGTSTEA